MLKDISLEIRPGEFFAVIGSTGCGKSSLVQLIPRFYDASEGHVIVDGMDVKDYSLTTLRERISYVLQKSELFSTTIRDNIALSRPDASEEEVIKATKTAQADDFIMRQPQGYDTPVTEQGMSLSGGQRQLLAIGRAFVSNPDILILDEATSSVDTRTEKNIQQAMKELMKGRTSLIIAHRLSTIQDADMIVVMDHGEIKETGTHEELLKKKGIYHSLYMTQFAGRTI